MMIRPAYLGILLAAAFSLPAVGDDPEPRTIAELNQRCRQLEKEIGKAKTDEQKSEMITRLCSLFVELGEHPELPDSPTLQNLSVRLRSRLAGLERRTVDELRKRKLPEPTDMVERRKQFNRSRSMQTNGQFQSASYGSTQASSDHSDSSTAASAGGNQGPPGFPEYGWQLVDLIRKTIRPDYWSVAGGPGKILYFGHSRALVVHGGWRVQEDVAQLLTALRGGE